MIATGSTRSTGNSDAPRVCICIPCYNAASTIIETLNSLLNQTYKNLLINVVDNASTDDTLAIVKGINDSRIHIHSRESTIPAEENFSRCIELSSGEYTAIFHADDVYEREMVARQVAYLEAHPEVSAAFSQATLINTQGGAIGEIGQVPGESSRDRRITFAELVKTMLKHQNYLVCPSAMVRTSIYRNDIRTWGDKAFATASDVDTWIRLTEVGPVVVLAERLIRYRVSDGQGSNRIRNRFAPADFFSVMDHHLERPEIKAFVTPQDLRNYVRLKRHDTVACSMNLFSAGRTDEARDRLKGLLGWDMIQAALLTRRGFVTFAAFGLLKLLLPFGEYEYCKKWVQSAKHIRWR